jgi:hypothetical protein
VEKNRERAAAIVTNEVLANREGAVEKLAAPKGSAATDELIHERPRWTQRLGGGEGTERLPFLRKCDVGRDRRLLRIWGRSSGQHERRQGDEDYPRSSHEGTSCSWGV